MFCLFFRWFSFQLLHRKVNRLTRLSVITARWKTFQSKVKILALKSPKDLALGHNHILVFLKLEWCVFWVLQVKVSWLPSSLYLQKKSFLKSGKFTTSLQSITSDSTRATLILCCIKHSSSGTMCEHHVFCLWRQEPNKGHKVSLYC